MPLFFRNKAVLRTLIRDRVSDFSHYQAKTAISTVSLLFL